MQIDFSTVDLEMAKVDVDDSPDSTPKGLDITGFLIVSILKNGLILNPLKSYVIVRR